MVIINLILPKVDLITCRTTVFTRKASLKLVMGSKICLGTEKKQVLTDFHDLPGSNVVTLTYDCLLLFSQVLFLCTLLTVSELVVA